MSGELKVDYSEFDRAAAQLIEKSHRSYPEFLNGEGWAVAKRALDATPLTDKTEISRLPFEPWWVRFVAKRLAEGHFYTRKRKGIKTLKVIQAARSGIGTSEYTKAAVDLSNRLIASRMRSIAFIKSGWIPAIRILAARAKGISARGSGTLGRRAGPGYAIPAESTLSGQVTCEIGNTSLLTESKEVPGRQSQPMKIALPALQQALDETARDMMEHLRQKMQPICDEHSAK